MGAIRRTVSLPGQLAKQIDRVARREKTSFSAAVASLVDEALRGRRLAKTMFRSMGAGESGVPDLGTNSEKHLDEIWREFDD